VKAPEDGLQFQGLLLAAFMTLLFLQRDSSSGSMSSTILTLLVLLGYLGYSYKVQSESKKVYLDAVSQYNKVQKATSDTSSTKTFSIKMSMVVQASPNEVATALFDCA
jgi:hypothetical protein